MDTILNLISTKLLDYGVLGVIALVAFYCLFIFLKSIETRLNANTERSEKYQERAYQTMEQTLNTLRTSFENHNQRSMEGLLNLQNSIDNVLMSIESDHSNLYKISHDLNAIVDESRAAVTEIRFVCPSRNNHQLGEILIQEGYLRQDELAEALRIQKAMNSKIG